jgi:hypothetical protein
MCRVLVRIVSYGSHTLTRFLVLNGRSVYTSPSPDSSSRHFRRTLLQRIQVELVATATHIPDPVEQRLLQQVASIIRRCENELLTSLETDSSAVPELVDRRRSDASTSSAGSEGATPVPIHTSRGAQLAPPGHAGNVAAWSGYGGGTIQPTVAWQHEQQPMLQDLITGWIDLDAVFPPPEDACNEPLVDFSMPRWSL